MNLFGLLTPVKLEIRQKYFWVVGEHWDETLVKKVCFIKCCKSAVMSVSDQQSDVREEKAMHNNMCSEGGKYPQLYNNSFIHQLKLIK